MFNLDNWNKESSEIGKLFHTWIAGILLVLSILGGANEYLSVIPSDFIPPYIKTIVVISGVISYVAGKLTKKEEVVKP
jgi:hypothetical protein